MITSVRNPFIRQVRALHRTKERQQQNMLLLEGTHLLEEACATAFPLAALCYTEEWYGRHPGLGRLAASRASRVEVVSDAVLKAIATTNTPDGVVATALRPPLTPAIDQGMAETLADPFLGMMVETLQDPGNLGTIIRTATAAAVHQLWLSQDSVDLTHPKVLRASAGQWFRLSMGISAGIKATIAELRAAHVNVPLQVIATTPTASLSYWDIDYTKPSLLLIGNEGNGLSEDVLAIADVPVHIPLAPGVESLNAAIATALLLYEAKRQRQQGGLG